MLAYPNTNNIPCSDDVTFIKHQEREVGKEWKSVTLTETSWNQLQSALLILCFYNVAKDRVFTIDLITAPFVFIR